MANAGRKPGAILTTTEQTRNLIVELCKSRSMSYDELSTELGFSYKTAWTYVQALIKDGRLVLTGMRDGKAIFGAIEQRSIPHIPGPTESISPMQMIGQIAKTRGKYKGKLENSTKYWNVTLCSILRTAVLITKEDKFPADRHAEYETYLKTYRGELMLRLAQVNALLQNDKFWTREGLADFVNDPGWDADVILNAYSSAVAELNPPVGDEK